MNTRNLIMLLCIAGSIVMGSSCANRTSDVDAALPRQAQTAPASPEALSPSTEEDEDDNGPVQLYSYEESKADNASLPQKREIVLEFSGQPIEIKGAGYIKFIGFIDGLLLIEIAGEGRIFARGDMIGAYRISRVEQGRVTLTAEEDALCAR